MTHLLAPRRRHALVVVLPGLDGTGKRLRHFLGLLGAEVETRIIDYPVDVPLGYEELEIRVRASLPEDREFVLLGESFSGPIALRIAASRPRALVGLVLCGTFAKNPYPWFGWAGGLAFLVPVKGLPRWLRAPLMWGARDSRKAPPNAERAIAQVARRVIRRRVAALLRVDATPSLRDITVPTLVLHARHDRIVPDAATAWMASRLPHARVISIDGPHLLLQAEPESCSREVRRFLDSLALRSDG